MLSVNNPMGLIIYVLISKHSIKIHFLWHFYTSYDTLGTSCGDVLRSQLYEFTAILRYGLQFSKSWITPVAEFSNSEMNTGGQISPLGAVRCKVFFDNSFADAGQKVVPQNWDPLTAFAATVFSRSLLRGVTHVIA